MLKRLLPWKFVIRHITRSYGLIDPFSLWARLGRFSQPSAIQTPIELLRAGIAFHARGLINTRTIQNNLDWVWPFWVEKQFNPQDPSFIPRAFSVTHVNLTNRNWTAVGLPHLPIYPIVDPRGLITPLFDGWSIDFWMFDENGIALLPSKIRDVDQKFIKPDLTVRTYCVKDGLELTTRVHMEIRDERPFLIFNATGFSPRRNSRMAVSLRPYNPEGIQFIEHIEYKKKMRTWVINSQTLIDMEEEPEKVLFSNYRKGDVLHLMEKDESEHKVSCEVGMATSAAVFSLEENRAREIEFAVPLQDELSRNLERKPRRRQTWESALAHTPGLTIPDKTVQSLYHIAKKTLILLSADDVFPGPYTYRRFWFRDACMIMHALLTMGLADRCTRPLSLFFERQRHSGYFQSQEGEWDSNGQVLWLFDRFYHLGGKDAFERNWLKSLRRGAMWIKHKRTPKNQGNHGGLLPAGFSAEHFGPNDFYYWDDFWGLAGLKAAARLAGIFGSVKMQKSCSSEAEDFEKAIFSSIARASSKLSSGGIPASPYRRMDSGAIGSLVADYPLQIVPPGHHLIKETVDYLMENCIQSGCFFQDMIHSGMNPYLSLCIAQSLLRMGDGRYKMLVENTARMASSTGQWPEAIHPFTGGGCMGDGQHGWAAAEWVLMIHHLFVREEKERLVLGSGIFPEWIASEDEIVFGPAPVFWGTISVRIYRKKDTVYLETHAKWHKPPPIIEINVPGYRPKLTDYGNGRHALIPLDSRSDKKALYG
ncbi:MAG: hypothetical protein R6U50_10565 [Desulfobacterales bacterium]